MASLKLPLFEYLTFLEGFGVMENLRGEWIDLDYILYILYSQ